MIQNDIQETILRWPRKAANLLDEELFKLWQAKFQIRFATLPDYGYEEPFLALHSQGDYGERFYSLKDIQAPARINDAEVGQVANSEGSVAKGKSVIVL